MFDDILQRTHRFLNWQKIPWHDPDFSRRMLDEHLSQAHDAASRRLPIVDQQVAWIHETLLAGQPSAILDLGCGPGLYSGRLAALGHTCTGIDFSPASIAHARATTRCAYVEGDLLTTPFGDGYDLVMLIYGELNAFAPEQAERIVAKAYDALRPGGRLLMEVHRESFVLAAGQQPPTWHSAASGLFADTPYLCLEESFQDGRTAITRFFVIDAQTGRTTAYQTMLYAYNQAEYEQLLHRFAPVTFYPTLANDASADSLCAVVAQKPG